MSDPHEPLRAALKLAASALRDHGPRFALGGSYALWVHGAPEPLHDVDLVVADADAEAAAATLEEAGFTIERTPENWLLKAHQDESTVDVLHRVNGVPVVHALLDRAVVHDVLAIRMPVLPVQDVVTAKLRSLAEHYCDFGALLPGVRAVRERLDWTQLHADTADNDYAAAFLVLTNRLGISG